MPAFNLEHERQRIQEAGLEFGSKVNSVKDNLRTLVAERTEAPSYFKLHVKENAVTADGYEHRGDLNSSFTKSEEEAQSSAIAERFRLETEGFNKAKKEFWNLPLYSTVLLFSPPPDMAIKGYAGYSMAYFYHIMPGKTSDEREIKAVAWVNRFDKEDQVSILDAFSEKKDIKPCEQSILTSPVTAKGAVSDTQSFKTLWSMVQKVYHDKKYANFICPPATVMEQYLLNGEELMKNKHLELDLMVDEIAKQLSLGASQDQIIDKFNIMLGLADRELLHKNWGHVDAVRMVPPGDSKLTFPQAQVLFDRNKHLGENVRKTETPCGPSGGMRKTTVTSIVSGISGQSTPVNNWSFTVKRENSAPFSVLNFGNNNLRVRDFEFDQPGPCRMCMKDVTCGPCQICESCNDKIDIQELSTGE